MPAWHNPVVGAWFDWYCRHALRRHFYAVREYGEAGPTPGRIGPRLVVAATHASFWDGIVLNWWLRRLGWRRRWCVVDAVQVRKHPFFRRIGGFGVERHDPADGRRAVRYAAARLAEADEETPAALVIFPQGRIVPPRLAFEAEAGAWLIARAADAPLLPLALAYEFWEEQRPELLIGVGGVDAGFGRTPRREAMDGLVRTTIDLRSRLVEESNQNAAGRVILRGRRSIKDLKFSNVVRPDT